MTDLLVDRYGTCACSKLCVRADTVYKDPLVDSLFLAERVLTV